MILLCICCWVIFQNTANKLFTIIYTTQFYCYNYNRLRCTKIHIVVLMFAYTAMTIVLLYHNFEIAPYIPLPVGCDIIEIVF